MKKIILITGSNAASDPAADAAAPPEPGAAERINMRLSFDFPADTGVLERISEIVGTTCREIDFHEEEIGEVQLAVDEACTNTIMHGLKRDPTRFFQLIVQARGNAIEILIRESGEAFDPEDVAVPDIQAPVEERPIGGLGMFFVQKLMDRVEYRFAENGEKTLFMSRKSRKTGLFS